jgi:hypothetical protein
VTRSPNVVARRALWTDASVTKALLIDEIRAAGGAGRESIARS